VSWRQVNSTFMYTRLTWTTKCRSSKTFSSLKISTLMLPLFSRSQVKTFVKMMMRMRSRLSCIRCK
jgi:hypothetical protein